jgi:YqjK-like protein
MTMRARLIALAERRARLAQRAQGEREQLATLLERGEAALAWLEPGRRLLQTLARRPLIVVAAVALLFVLRPRRTFKWLLSGWSLWRLYRQASRWWQHLDAAAGAPARRPG